VAFEHPTSAGTVRLTTRAGAGWMIRFVGKARGCWHSPDAAAKAVAQHQEHLPVSEDIIDWRPLGESN
jgi:hypothetical protein